MESFGKALTAFGLIIAALGLWMWLAPGSFRLFRLPGDLVIQRGSFSLYVPLATMLILSLALTLIGWLVGWLRR